jgi:hypothetical protein
MKLFGSSSTGSGKMRLALVSLLASVDVTAQIDQNSNW